MIELRKPHWPHKNRWLKSVNTAPRLSISSSRPLLPPTTQSFSTTTATTRELARLWGRPRSGWFRADRFELAGSIDLREGPVDGGRDVSDREECGLDSAV